MWVPFECVSTYFVEPDRLGGIFQSGSNGLASGNHVLEAIVHAICEVIERDACTLRTIRGGAFDDERQVAAATIVDPHARDLIEQLERAEITVAIWDVASDVGIPTFTCQIADQPDGARWTLKGIFGGNGCHLDPTVALLRAITEAAQSRLTQIAGSRDDMFSYDTQANPDDLRIAADVALRAAPRSMDERDLSTATFEGDIEVLVDALQQAGIDQVVVVDLTHPDVGIPVVTVVVPGLEPMLHSSFRYGSRALAAAGEA
jgi:YcaO-like protein with predicted kinase domain